MIGGPDSTVAVDPAAARAAEAVMRNTARRLRAPRADLDQVLAVLFGPTVTLLRENAGLDVRQGTPASPADRARIRELIAAGRENSAIADEVGCSVQTVIGVRAGLTSARRTGLTVEKKQEIYVLLAEGLTQREVAERVGVARTTVAYVKSLRGDRD